MVSIIETSEHAAKSYLSTLAVLQLDSILVGAKKVSVRKPKKDNKTKNPLKEFHPANIFNEIFVFSPINPIFPYICRFKVPKGQPDLNP